jgi:hypothetical protein
VNLAFVTYRFKMIEILRQSAVQYIVYSYTHELTTDRKTLGAFSKHFPPTIHKLLITSHQNYKILYSCKVSEIFARLTKIKLSGYFMKVFKFGFPENSLSWRRFYIFRICESVRIRRWGNARQGEAKVFKKICDSGSDRQIK